ncbi:molybdate ABC transporter substrate-binding protein [Aeromicrobium terrae]|uniref:Molybdate ABC transporter substrate-binding protein n=1 Tax=Aeromicrobium terrae TaxID=2498846 RepID=A0A5C8NJP3_9ACTN|nr:molybdate ABC transporter substrate-binding protein [Aeromicrobium terrae]TXL61498.1 molybdate ABC transporter substrate-binding protein [Aeromicrobium terrae]
MRRATVLALVVALTACGSGSDGSSGRTTLKVLAASSLTESFTALEQRYEKAHPGVDVKLSFDSSAILVEQLSQGLDADVLATADTATMDKAEQAGVVTGTPTVFASNTLVIATPRGNPAGIRGLDDLATSTFAVCVPAAPCGDAAQRLFQLEGFTAKPTTEEENVKGVLTKVVTGEVDAGLVYVSDAQAAGDQVEVVQAANASEVVNVDPIAAVKGGDRGAAQDWIRLITGAEGQRVLASFGFGPRA